MKEYKKNFVTVTERKNISNSSSMQWDFCSYFKSIPSAIHGTNCR